MPAVSPKPLQIAIDGPVGSGKSDISARLAKELGLVYFYTGAMYRAVAYACIQNGIPFKDVHAVTDLLQNIRVELVQPDPESHRAFKVLLDGRDVTESLFQPDVDHGSSDVSTIAEVRAFMVNKQKEMAQGKSVVMEGRDIGLRVLPDAQLKIYLTANLRERANRRYLQWIDRGVTNKTLEDAVTETASRDDQDMHRQVDPLQKLPEAWELDTTGLTQDEVVARIHDELITRNLL